MVCLSYLVGLNTAAFAYFAAFRHLRRYLGIPFTVVAFYMGRNLSVKGSISRLYQPIEPLYKEVRKHQTVTEVTPHGAKGVKDIEKATQVLDDAERTPLLQRTDISKADKRKIMRQTRERRKSSVKEDAEQMVNNDYNEAKQALDHIVEKVHGRFINEEDFLETGHAGYKKFVDAYIAYRYEPLIEEYDEARY